MPPPKRPPPKKAAIVRDKGTLAIPPIDYGTPDDINEPSDDFNGYVRCIFGAKGVGKSTIAAQCPKNFTWMFEPLRRNLRIWQKNLVKKTSAEIMAGADDPWQQLKETIPRQLVDPNIETLTFDSADIAYECCKHHIFALNGVTSPGESKNGPDIWGQVSDEWSGFFNILAESRLAINLLSHLKNRENEELDGGKVKRKSPSCSPACLLYIKQAADFIFFYGKVDGNKRVMQVRDEDGGTECSAGAENRFYQPNGKPIYYLEMPDLLDKESGYDRLCSAFSNKCWDYYTSDAEKEVKPQAPSRKGPPSKK